MILTPDVAESQGQGSKPCILPERCFVRMDVGAGLKLPVYTSHPFDRTNSHIRRAVIVVHGSSRNAYGYFKSMVRSAIMERQLDETLIVTPWFSIKSDTDRGHGMDAREPGDLYWRRSSHWKKGHRSARVNFQRISSFEIIDSLRTRLASKNIFPNLAKLTIIGFSAGGQFVQRYAVGSIGAQELSTRFVVSSPSSYMYFDRYRPAQMGTGFEVRLDTSDCRVNRYKYGSEGLNSYMNNRSLSSMVKSYRYLDLVYLIGADDNDPEHGGLDTSCPALAQGANRVARALNFKAYMDRFHAPHNHRIVVVPDVAHSSAKMFRSSLGREVVFNW